MAQPLYGPQAPRNRQQELFAQALLQQALAPQEVRSPVEGIAKVLAGGIGGYLAGGSDRKEEARRTAAGETYAQALRAGTDWKNPDNPNQVLTPGNPAMMAQVLAGNPDTAQAGLQFQMSQLEAAQKARMPIKLGAGETIYDPVSGTSKFTAPKPEEPFTLSEGQRRYNPQGGEVAAVPPKSDLLSPDALNQKLQIAGASRPSTEVKVEQKTGESLAKPIGEMVESTRAGALGAVDTIDTINRVRGSMSNINLGPTATLRQNIDRFANVLGVSGATTDERLANTQQAIKGLAELTLSGRQSLKGQGQVSDFEGRLLEKAKSGNIDEMTAPELETLLGTAEKIARKQYELHGANIQRLRDNPSYRDIAPFYEVPQLPALSAQPTKTWQDIAPGIRIREK